MSETFEEMLTGGHPNSLGRTVEVVDCVSADPDRMAELFACYRSADEVVRSRVSNAMRRVQAERPDFFVPLIDPLIDEIGALDQPSAQWKLPKLFEGAASEMNPDQLARARALVQRNLAEHHDWIVLNNSIDYLTPLAKGDAELRAWFCPHLERLSNDTRKSVARRAARALKLLGEN
ncbi:MAG: hypothetical protein AAGH68_10205 [Pseudomonadota bacterium]